MSEFEFPSFPQPTEDARALLERLYREIGVAAVAAALEIDVPREAPRPARVAEAKPDRVRAA